MGAIAIDRSVAEVWQTLIHFEHRAEYAPRVKSAVIVEQQADFIRVKMEIDASVTTARYTMRFQLDEPAKVITFRLDDTAKDNTIAAAEGEYRLYEVAPQRTLLVYRSYVDTGRAVPGFIQDYMAKKSVPNLLKAIKKRVESGGTWKK
jgi:carbon monoxide dehydrogenase subunit G